MAIKENKTALSKNVLWNGLKYYNTFQPLIWLNVAFAQSIKF